MPEIQHFPANPATAGRFLSMRGNEGMCTGTGPHDMIFAMKKDRPIVSGNHDVMGGTAVFHGMRFLCKPCWTTSKPGNRSTISFEEAKDRVV
jgi:hypothetical protein